MDWREILEQLEAQLASLERQGVGYLNLAPDQALARQLSQASPVPEAATGTESRGRAAQLAARLKGGTAIVTGQPPPEPAPPPEEDLSRPPRVASGGAASLDELSAEYGACMACALAGGRNCLVFGAGHERSAIMFIGEGPGAEEDQQGLPFVGRAGALLTGMIQALGLTRDDVYITNVVKCRPPGNRNPQPEEIAACRPILQQQIELLDPKLIVTLGNVPLKVLRPNAAGITRERGRTFSYGNWQVLPTFHPSYLLRNQAAIQTCWLDFKLAFRLAYPQPGG
ncbi:MAG: uracil-DNA glycosylase [SAR324 cluster bacterium]|nr:uracil-DNA glycosylase [SAR324 cluster bacterium]